MRDTKGGIIYEKNIPNNILCICNICYSQQDLEITYLSCIGTENVTSFSKNPKGDTTVHTSEVVMNFNSKTKNVIGGTRMLSLGCFPTDFIDVKKATCDCKVTDDTIECKSLAPEKDLKIVHDDEFSVNRRTAEMTTFRKWVSNGITSSITYGKLKCRKVDQKF